MLSPHFMRTQRRGAFSLRHRPKLGSSTETSKVCGSNRRWFNFSLLLRKRAYAVFAFVCVSSLLATPFLCCFLRLLVHYISQSILCTLSSHRSLPIRDHDQSTVSSSQGSAGYLHPPLRSLIYHEKFLSRRTSSAVDVCTSTS